MRDIGRASGLTQGTIYSYVRSKEDILYLVCDRIVSEYLASMHQAMEAEGDLVARLRAALTGVAKVMVMHKDGILMLYRESHNLDRAARSSIVARVSEFVSTFECLLAEVSVVHPLSVKDNRFLANIMTYLPTVFALRGWAFPPDVPEEQLVANLVKFMATGLGRSEA